MAKTVREDAEAVAWSMALEGQPVPEGWVDEQVAKHKGRSLTVYYLFDYLASAGLSVLRYYRGKHRVED